MNDYVESMDVKCSTRDEVTEIHAAWDEQLRSVPAIDYTKSPGGRHIWMNHRSAGGNKHRYLNLWHPEKKK